MSTAPAAVGQRLLIRNVSWGQYEALLEWVGERQLRIAYDRGDLELMSPSVDHEDFKRLFARLIAALAEELDATIHDYGSATWRREDLDQGIEPDECFYIQSEPLIRGRSDINLDRDPPPDLVLEIDITSSSVDRQGIYAALGVPELWRYDGETLCAFRLGPDGTYLPTPTSLAFPPLPLEAFAEFIPRGRGANLTAWTREFRAWVRDHVLPRNGGEPREEARP